MANETEIYRVYRHRHKIANDEIIANKNNQEVIKIHKKPINKIESHGNLTHILKNVRDDSKQHRQHEERIERIRKGLKMIGKSKMNMMSKECLLVSKSKEKNKDGCRAVQKCRHGVFMWK